MPSNTPLDGGITDGDDHVWTGDVDILKRGGGWHDLDHQNSQPKVSGTRKAQDVERMAKRVKFGNGRQHLNNQESHSKATSWISDQIMQSKSGKNMETRGTKFAHAIEVIDLTHSSPAAEDALEMESQQHLSSVEYGSEDGYENDMYQEKLLQKAKAFEEAAQILCSQIPHTNWIWMKSIYIVLNLQGKNVTQHGGKEEQR
ncbi:hypothetical protein L208DRAFT_1378239 [Tricholoma matsutake]|nr:hypothetical protein L208DRAFT_1378239 [Tricholoma matsutake 945]